MRLPSDGDFSGKEITMYRRCMVMTILTLVLAASGTVSAEQHLREATVRQTAAGHEVSFVVEEPVDVTVRIVDARGRVVRHLACGMVGLEKAAAPFAPKALSQKIVWDGKDDEDEPVEVEGCSAVVLAGMEATFDRLLLEGHDTFAADIAAFGGSNRTGHIFTANLNAMIHRISFVREFDREGHYVRTVWPLNPNMDRKQYLDFLQREDTCAWKQYNMHWAWGTKDYDGKWVLGELHDNVFGGLLVASLTQVADGRIVGMRSISSPRAFIVWAEDGRVVNHAQVVAPWYKMGDPLNPWTKDALNICSGPEGKLVYVTDAGQIAKGGKVKWGWVVGCFDATTLKPVSRFAWSGLKKLDTPVYHLGTPNESGEDEAHFKAPTGVAIDYKGRFWVADADCLKVYADDGKFLKRIDAKTPGFEEVQFYSAKIGADYDSGGIYVVTGGKRRSRKDRKLYKVDSLENLKIVWEIPLTFRYHYGPARQVFVDSKANIVWVARGAGPRTLLRVVDKGATFEKKVIDGNAPGKLLKPQWMRTDSAGNIYILDMGRKAILKTDIDGNNVLEIPVKVTSSDGYFCLDREDNLYITEWSWRRPFRLRKFDSDGSPLKIGGKEALDFTGPDDWIRDERNGRVKGVCVVPNGDIYVAGSEPYHQAYALYKKDRTMKASWVNVYTADGVLKKAKLVQIGSINEIQVGRDGLYAVQAGFGASTGMRNQVARDKEVAHWTLYNKLQKYSLEGGVENGDGHLWNHAGVGFVNSMACGYECAGAQMCIDKDDRVWIPEHIVYNVKAVDSAGNLIARIGTYGNADCDGDPNGKNPRPAIPITWPVSIARHKDYLLIADRISARVVRCRLAYRDRKEIKLN